MFSSKTHVLHYEILLIWKHFCKIIHWVPLTLWYACNVWIQLYHFTLFFCIFVERCIKSSQPFTVECKVSKCMYKDVLCQEVWTNVRVLETFKGCIMTATKRAYSFHQMQAPFLAVLNRFAEVILYPTFVSSVYV